MVNHRMKVAGFTLLEVLIAISLFVIVLSSVYGAYRQTFANVNITDEQVRLGAAARVILERISTDLETVALDRQGNLVGKRGDVSGKRGDGLEVVAYCHLPFGRGEVAGGRTVLAYSIAEDPDGLLDLYRSDQPVRPQLDEVEPQRGDLLGRRLLEFRLTYVDAEGAESEEWSSEPLENTKNGEQQEIVLPALIRVTIRLATDIDDTAGTLYRTAVALPRSGKIKASEVGR